MRSASQQGWMKVWNFKCNFHKTAKCDLSTFAKMCFIYSFQQQYHFAGRCNRITECTDASDEIGCECEDDEFTCACIPMGTCFIMDGCKNQTELLDGFIQCPDGRILFENQTRINIHRLHNLSECNDIGFPGCDNSTCYRTNFPTCVDNNCFESHVLCTSYCDQDLCRGVFQCSNNNTVFLSQFCDGIVDCFDGSDEFTNQPGFKCNECVLPQNNLYDDVAHCDNNSDRHPIKQFFECFDNRLLILPQQVCDGVRDCYDMSDECLCDTYFDIEMCTDMFENKNLQCFDNESLKIWQNFLSDTASAFTEGSTSGFVRCQTKFNGSIFTKTCDGRPECRDFSDECECSNPPLFCNDSCHFYFPMGDRYCDGVEDPAWQYINRSDCSRGFDEMFCPKRFKCNAAGKVSIDVLQVCDGKPDCNDNSDESNCPTATKISSVFSSDTEMIADVAIKSAFWIMGILVMVGNSCVIIQSISFLKTKKTLDGVRFHQFIILNISIADFIMGIYLITIASYDAAFSGFYGNVDREWRSSLKCSVIGSLAVISSETSCFLMVALTSFRLKNITQAMESLTASLRPWKICIIAAWLFSFFIGIAPMLPQTSQYFLHSFSYSSPFQNSAWYSANLKQFACRLSALSNTTIELAGSEFQSVETFVAGSFPNDASVKLFGYYGETSVCMPRFYVGYGESSWAFTIAMITLNFLSFIFIAVSYVVIYKHSTASSANLGTNRPNNQAATMQKRIARIIATDFCCWIPICVLAFVRLGVEFSDIAYQISAVLLLPINSAINPLLFSSLSDKLIDLCRHTYQKLKNVCGV